MQTAILKNTLALLVSKLVPSLLLTLINVLFSRFLSQNEYGIYQTVWTYLSIFVIISTFGLPRYILTYGSLYQYSKGMIYRLIAFVFLLTIVPLTFYLIFFDSVFSNWTIFLFILLLISQSIYLIQEANVLSLTANKLLIVSNVSYAILLFAAHLLLLFIGYSIDLCLMMIIGVSIIRNVIIFLSVKNQFTKEQLLSTFKERLQLVWFGINDTLQILTKWIDKIILVLILPSAEYAIYFNGTYEIPLIGMGLSAFQTILTTQSAKADSTEATNIALFNTAAMFMSGILFPLFAFCVLFADEIIFILFGSKYVESASLFAITALLIPMRICNYTVLLQLKSRGDIILIGSLIDFAVAITLMIFLYPISGLNGLALSIVIATYIQAAFYLVKISSIYKTRLSILLPLKQLAVRFVIVLGVFLVVKFALSQFSGVISLSGGALVFAVFVLVFLKKSIDFKKLLPFRS